MSVCTGAFILARAGLLDTLNITTHYGSLSALQDLLPSATVLEHTRYVDNDRILTTAGVSAGIDGALHLVARIKGLNVATSTAHYMEYEKWNPEDGIVRTINPYLSRFSELNESEKGNSENKENQEIEIPFEGELIAFVESLHLRNAYHSSVPLLEKGIKWYPHSAGLYDQLGMAYAKEGKPAPMSNDSFMRLIEDNRIEEAIVVFEKAKENFPGWLIFSEAEMNDAAYDLARRENYKDALKLFELNTKAFPTSANVWDSLGEGYLMAGNKKDAILYYQKSLKIDPGNENAIRMLQKLEAKNE
jgi:tetratricopeptide (TPR) repeat protein